jgi:hypothetical protein
MSLRSSWVLSLLLLLAISPYQATAQSSKPTSTAPTSLSQVAEPLWQSLLQATQALPQAMDSFMSNLQSQVDSLQASNEQLDSSNKSLMLQDAQLQASLQASQTLVATSAAKLAQLQTALNASTSYTIAAEADLKEAQAAAQALANWDVFWKVTTVAGVLGTVAAVVYAVLKP